MDFYSLQESFEKSAKFLGLSLLRAKGDRHGLWKVIRTATVWEGHVRWDNNKSDIRLTIAGETSQLLPLLHLGKRPEDKFYGGRGEKGHPRNQLFCFDVALTAFSPACQITCFLALDDSLGLCCTSTTEAR